ncbi:unnamed protein product [Chironomus riparius]|uniref:Uncharacterized protein n=1 Tax=Chironomus riparius TaxID=315576 RepID=A0A9N9RT59_9DIPT|nr:unnamed protein product [Chironomus riparius]
MRQFVVLCVLALFAGAFADIGLDLQHSNGYNYEPPENPMYLPPKEVVEVVDSAECPPPPPAPECPAPPACPPIPPPVTCPAPPPPPKCPPPPVCPPAPVCPEQPDNSYLPPSTDYLPPGRKFKKLF